jgi:hypothetical protein
MAALVFLSLIVFLVILALATGLTLMGRLGPWGKRLTAALCHTPGLDLALIVLVWLPWLGGFFQAGWAGLLSALVGQILATEVWVWGHRWIYRRHRPPVGINSYLSQRYGWWRNHLALWITASVLPVFFLIRAAQVLLYPWLIWLLGFKAYDQREWINISRHRVRGLVGHDLLWCLYCDWMTGVYALGAEMLRNVESFWCPIRFYHDKKCDNCSVDFPDINRNWFPADSSVDAVVEGLDAAIPRDRPWVWSHPADAPQGQENSTPTPK